MRQSLSSMRHAPPDTAAAAGLSIGALSRATRIPVETLRTWEARYGFPSPARKASGHRLYPASIVPRLLLVAEALSRGLRAGEIVGATEAQLDELLQATSASATVAAAGSPRFELSASDVSDALRAVRAFDTDALTRLLLTDSMRLGVLAFLERSVAPLISAVGEEWAKGAMDISHEHFLTARIGEMLGSLRLPYDDRATGPIAVLSTLPGEAHALGLQMAALVLAAAAWRVVHLGPEAPPEQVAQVARECRARAVAISMSSANRGETSRRRLMRLRELLPRSVALLVGGNGAPHERPGLSVVPDLRALDAWARAARPAL